MTQDGQPRRPAAPDHPVRAETATSAARANLYLTPLTAALSLGSVVIVARTLSPSEFALFALAVALRATFQYLLDFGTGSAATRIFAEMNARAAGHEARRLYLRLLSARLAVFFVMAVVFIAVPAAPMQLLGLQEDEGDLLIFAVVIMALELAATLGYYTLAAGYGQRRINLVAVAANVVQPAAVIGAALMGAGVSGILVGVVLGSCVRALGWNVGAVGWLRAMPSSGSTRSSNGTYAKVTVATILAKAAAWLHSRQFLVLLAVASRPRLQAAAFAIAYDFAQQIMSLATSPSSGLAIPTFVKQSASPERDEHVLRLATRGIALLALPVSAVTIAVLPELLPLVFGKRYEDAVAYGLIIVPLLAVEFVLSIPVTGYMLARDEHLRPFASVKVLAILSSTIYFLSGSDLLVLVVLMMCIRVISAASLHIAVYARSRIHVEWSWLLRFVVLALAACAAGRAAAVPNVPAGIDVALSAAVATAALLIGLRVTDLLRMDDVMLATRIFPPARRAVAVLRPTTTNDGGASAC